VGAEVTETTFKICTAKETGQVHQVDGGYVGKKCFSFQIRLYILSFISICDLFTDFSSYVSCTNELANENVFLNGKYALTSLRDECFTMVDCQLSASSTSVHTVCPREELTPKFCSGQFRYRVRLRVACFMSALGWSQSDVVKGK
jgi:hypothetical protein